MTLSNIHGRVGAVTIALAVLFAALLDSAGLRLTQICSLTLLFAYLAIDPAACTITALLRLRRNTEQLTTESPAVPDEPKDSERVAIVVPAVIAKRSDVDRILATLKVHRETAGEGDFYYGILTDFRDSPRHIEPDDESILSALINGIDTLNRDLGSADPRYFLMHRPRRWSERQDCWLGYERKRGKLREFNRYLITGSLESYSVTAGPVEELPGTNLVLTLDEDTLCTAGAASKLAQRMRDGGPIQIDAEGRVVRNGFAILQPSIGARIRSTPPTRYEKLSVKGTNEMPSLDYIYSLYFREFPFMGKGLYNVRVFEHVLTNRFPPDWILSHDNIEGHFLRCGSVPDVELLETRPASMPEEYVRLHRWVRGDVQCLPWALPQVPTEAGVRAANPLSPLARTRIVNSVRTSLSTSVAFVLLLSSQFYESANAEILVGTLGLLALPTTLGLVMRIFSRSTWGSSGGGPRALAESASADLVRFILRIVSLPTDAFITAHAAVLAIWRMKVSRKHMLKWRASTLVAAETSTSLYSHFRTFAPNLVASVSLLFAGRALQVPASNSTTIIITMWISAPIISFWLSQPSEEPLEEDSIH